MKLILVRHGETIENAQGIYQGHSIGTLSRKGIEQAKKVALRLKDEKIDVIFVSDLKRAVDTAEEIIKYHSETEVIYEPKIRERSAGIYEGKPWGTMEAIAEEQGINFIDYKPENGESIVEFIKRIQLFLDELIEEYLGKNVMFITHGGPIIQTLLKALGLPNERWKECDPGNTAVSIIEFDVDKNHKIYLRNCVKHLEN